MWRALGDPATHRFWPLYGERGDPFASPVRPALTRCASPAVAVSSPAPLSGVVNLCSDRNPAVPRPAGSLARPAQYRGGTRNCATPVPGGRVGCPGRAATRTLAVGAPVATFTPRKRRVKKGQEKNAKGEKMSMSEAGGRREVIQQILVTET